MRHGMFDGDMMEAIAENTTRLDHPPCAHLSQYECDSATLVRYTVDNTSTCWSIHETHRPRSGDCPAQGH